MSKVDHNPEGQFFSFKVVVEPDAVEHGRPVYHISCTALNEYGAATWVRTEGNALEGVREAAQTAEREPTEDGGSIPEGPEDKAYIVCQPRVSVTI